MKHVSLISLNALHIKACIYVAIFYKIKYKV